MKYKRSQQEGKKKTEKLQAAVLKFKLKDSPAGSLGQRKLNPLRPPPIGRLGLQLQSCKVLESFSALLLSLCLSKAPSPCLQELYLRPVHAHRVAAGLT